MKEILDKTIKVSSTTELGVPFGKAYWRPTPSFWRKLGDTLIIVGSTITSISAFTMPPIVTAIAAICTGLGKIITNCAKSI
jgi:hypothetical protein